MASYVDPEYLLTHALTTALPGDVNVGIAVDTDTPLRVPAVLVTANSGTPATNGDPRWSGIWTVSITCLARGLTAAQALADTALAVLVELEGTTVPGAGFVSTVDVDMLPRRTPPDIANATAFAQFNFSITARLRPTEA